MKGYRLAGGEALAKAVETEYTKGLSDYHLKPLNLLDPDGKPDISMFPAEWQRFAAEAAPERFTALIDAIREARKQNTFNVNFQAIIEQLLLIFTGESDLWAN